MEISALVEVLEIEILDFCFGIVRSNRKIHLVFLCYVIFEFLFYFYLSEPLFQTVSFGFNKLRQIIWNLLVWIKTEKILGVMTYFLELLNDSFATWKRNLSERHFDQWFNDQRWNSIIILDKFLPIFIRSILSKKGHQVPQFKRYFIRHVRVDDESELFRVIFQKMTLMSLQVWQICFIIHYFHYFCVFLVFDEEVIPEFWKSLEDYMV